MLLRLVKCLAVLGPALFFTAVAYGNIVDNGTNLAFVQHVLSMDTTFGSPAIAWRAIHDEAAQRLAYQAIIGWEAATALVLWIGLLRLAMSLGNAAGFAAGKGIATLGLGLGFALYGIGFLVVA